MLEGKYTIENEKKIQKLWDETQAFRFNGLGDRKVYSVDTPPPTVSGSLHVGHIFSFTQAEMIVRYHRLKGENVFYPLGFDDNGLPTERLVEKKIGIKASDMSRSDFVQKCNTIKEEYIKEFQDLFKRLGISTDWNISYDTINELSRKISQKSFIDLVNNGHAYRKEMPVLWCPCCSTSIAQAELDNKISKSYFNYINFSCEGENIEIATTRPEFLAGVVAVMVNPLDSRFQKIIGKKVKVPLYDFEVPVIGDSKVSMDKGTGVVMCATFGDQMDMEWQREYNLPIKKVINNDGTINNDIPIIGGMNTIDAREKIISLLKEKKYLVKSEKIDHSVSIHERCGNEIEIINSPQWYIDVLNIKNELIKAADDINWYPASMKKRYLDWVNNLKWDWCISRQRFFGVPFPVWYCADCGEVILANENDLPLNPFDSIPNKKCKCGSCNLIPENAVMDTWATSSVTPFINMKYKENNEQSFLFPMSMRSHAHEIIRTWTFYTIVKSLYHTGKLPWNDLMITGFVLAKKGEKISKSKGNAVKSPNELIDTYGADLIRYWTASNKLGTDTWFDSNILNDLKRFFNKLWNSAKFVDMHIKDVDLNKEVSLTAIDKWIISRCHETFAKYQEQMEKYEVGLARIQVDNFFWKDFCDNYLEIVKERLYNRDGQYNDTQYSAQKALGIVFLEILKMYSPFVPHITEYIYQNIYNDKCNDKILSCSIYKDLPCDEKYLQYGELVKNIIAEVRKFKSIENLSMKDYVDSIKIITTLENIKLIRNSINDILSCIKVKNIEFEIGEDLDIEINNLSSSKCLIKK